MNNFVFSQDPILYSSTIPQYQQDPVEIKKQLDVVMAQYQQLQQSKNEAPQSPTQHIDYLGELDSILMNLDEGVIQMLNGDAEFVELNNGIQQIIQTEMVNSIKWKVNSNPEISNKISRMKTIINNVRKEKESEQRRSMNELNDYIQNYSDMTFNEYKKIKAARE